MNLFSGLNAASAWSLLILAKLQDEIFIYFFIDMPYFLYGKRNTG